MGYSIRGWSGMSSWHAPRILPQFPVPLRLFLIRHGESQANVESGIVSGRQPHVALTALGERQSVAVGQYFLRKNISCDLYFCSPTTRTKQTAHHALHIHEWYHPNHLETSEWLHEIDMGDWVGKPYSEVLTDQVQKEIEKDAWSFSPPSGESQRQVEDRMLEFMSSTLQERVKMITEKDHRACSNKEINVAIFGHCVANTSMMRTVLS